MATNTFDTPQNLFNVARNCAFVGIIALGMTAVIVTGGIDLSVGSVLALSGMVTGMMMSSDYPIWLAIPAGLGAALRCGFVNGVFIAYIGMPPFVVTLGMMSSPAAWRWCCRATRWCTISASTTRNRLRLAAALTRGWFNGFAEWVGTQLAAGRSSPARGPRLRPQSGDVPCISRAGFRLCLSLDEMGRRIFAIGGNENSARFTGGQCPAGQAQRLYAELR